MRTFEEQLEAKRDDYFERDDLRESQDSGVTQSDLIKKLKRYDIDAKKRGTNIIGTLETSFRASEELLNDFFDDNLGSEMKLTNKKLHKYELKIDSDTLNITLTKKGRKIVYNIELVKGIEKKPKNEYDNVMGLIKHGLRERGDKALRLLATFGTFTLKGNIVTFKSKKNKEYDIIKLKDGVVWGLTVNFGEDINDLLDIANEIVRIEKGGKKKPEIIRLEILSKLGSTIKSKTYRDAVEILFDKLQKEYRNKFYEHNDGDAIITLNDINFDIYLKYLSGGESGYNGYKPIVWKVNVAILD